MTIEQLDKVHKTRPFKPFTIHLADGTSVPVRHPEFLSRSPAGRTVVVHTEGENMEIIDLLLVTKITLGNGSASRSRS